MKFLCVHLVGVCTDSGSRLVKRTKEGAGFRALFVTVGSRLEIFMYS